MLSRTLRIVSLTMSWILLLSVGVWPCAAVSAEETAVQPRYSYTCYNSTGLDITTDGTAYCLADAEGYDGITTKIHIQMTLQRSIRRRWTDIATWEGTFYDVVGALSETTTTTTGTHRVKAIFTVYSGSDYEVIENISQEKYISVTG